MTWLLNKIANNYSNRPDECNDFLWSNLYPEMIEEHTTEVKDYFLAKGNLFVKDLSEMTYGTLADFLNFNTDRKGFPRLNRGNTRF